MVLKLQKIDDLKTEKEKRLYRKVFNLILKEKLKNTSYLLSKSFISDRSKRAKKRINILVKNGKVNPEIIKWLDKSSRTDLVGFDDLSQKDIKNIKYQNYLTKSERKKISEIRKINNKRTEAALIKDLMGNENIIPIEQWKKWKKNPKKYDIEGIDTVPISFAGATASEIERRLQTTTKKKKYTRGMGNELYGKFIHYKNPEVNRRYIHINRLIKGTKESNKTIAHEIGHSYDLLVNKFKKPNLKIIKEMKKMSEIIRPIGAGITFDNWKKKYFNKKMEKYMKYRNKHTELFADSFVMLMHKPNFVKKNYPNFYNYVTKDERILQPLKEKRYELAKLIVKRLKGDKKFLQLNSLKNKIFEEIVILKKLKSFKKIGKIRKMNIIKQEIKINKMKLKFLDLMKYKKIDSETKKKLLNNKTKREIIKNNEKLLNMLKKLT